MKRYYFKDVIKCEMCGSDTDSHKVLGHRLNKSQGSRPKKKTGISVTIQKCRKCKLIYSNPQPIPFNLQDHYGKPTEKYWNEDFFLKEPNYNVSRFNEIKSLIGFKKGMKSLDIGAGLGRSMKSLEKAGFDAYGLEPSVSFYNEAISNMKDVEKLKLGTIEEVEYKNNTFDLITFDFVCEHLSEPSIGIQKALNWLKPNGVILISVPSSRWLMSRFMNLYLKLIGTNYVANLSPMHPPYHLYEFDEKSFEELSKKLNYKIIKHLYSVGLIYFIPKFLHPILKKYMKLTDKGMLLYVFLKKQ